MGNPIVRERQHWRRAGKPRCPTMAASIAPPRARPCRSGSSGLKKEDPLDDGSSRPALGRFGMGGRSGFRHQESSPLGDTEAMTF